MRVGSRGALQPQRHISLRPGQHSSSSSSSIRRSGGRLAAAGCGAVHAWVMPATDAGSSMGGDPVETGQSPTAAIQTPALTADVPAPAAAAVAVAAAAAGCCRGCSTARVPAAAEDVRAGPCSFTVSQLLLIKSRCTGCWLVLLLLLVVLLIAS